MGWSSRGARCDPLPLREPVRPTRSSVVAAFGGDPLPQGERVRARGASKAHFATIRPSTPVLTVPILRRYSTTSFTIIGASLSGVMRLASRNMV
jgi:hypothetical protein